MAYVAVFVNNVVVVIENEGLALHLCCFPAVAIFGDSSLSLVVPLGLKNVVLVVVGMTVVVLEAGVVVLHPCVFVSF